VLYSINPVFQLKLHYQLIIEVSFDKPGLSVDKPGFSAINTVYRIKHTTACHDCMKNVILCIYVLKITLQLIARGEIKLYVLYLSLYFFYI